MSSIRFHMRPNSDVLTVHGRERAHGLEVALETTLRVLGANTSTTRAEIADWLRQWAI